MNKKELYNKIMESVAVLVKKALNEDSFIENVYPEEFWGIEDYDDEADENGKIIVTLSEFSHGGREANTADWELEVINNEDTYWDVLATCIKSEIRKYKKGQTIEFEVDKETSIWDLNYNLQQELDYEYRAR